MPGAGASSRRSTGLSGHWVDLLIHELFEPEIASFGVSLQFFTRHSRILDDRIHDFYQHNLSLRCRRRRQVDSYQWCSMLSSRLMTAGQRPSAPPAPQCFPGRQCPSGHLLATTRSACFRETGRRDIPGLAAWVRSAPKCSIWLAGTMMGDLRTPLVYRGIDQRRPWPCSGAFGLATSVVGGHAVDRDETVGDAGG